MVNLEGKKCQRLIPRSNSWNKWKEYCGKTAGNIDENGRYLCVTCSRKHNKNLQIIIDKNKKEYHENHI